VLFNLPSLPRRGWVLLGILNPRGPDTGPARVFRGSSYASPASGCRSADRGQDNPTVHYHFHLGFRVVCEIRSRQEDAVTNAPRSTKPAIVRLDLKPDPKAWEIKPGSPLNAAALVTKPAPINGLRSWTLEIRASRGEGQCGALSPDDKLYAAAGRDGVIRFFDSPTGKLQAALVNPETDIAALCWSPDSTYVAVGSRTGVVRIWNVAQGVLVVAPGDSSTNAVSSLAWSPDGALLAIGRRAEPAVVLWDVREAKQHAVLEDKADANRSVNYLAWSSDGKQLAATTDVAVRIWDVAGARVVQSLDPQTPQDQAARLAAAWSADGKQIATLCGDRKMKLFDSTYKLVRSAELGYTGPAGPSLAWSRDGRYVAGAWFNGGVVVNTATGAEECGVDGIVWGDTDLGLSWSNDSSRLFCTASKSGTVSALDRSTRKLAWQVVGRISFDGTDICTSPDGRQYATATFGDRLRAWDLTGGALVRSYGPIYPVRGQVTWIGDRMAVASGGWRGEWGTSVWNTRTASEPQTYRGDAGFWSAAWSPDAKTLALGEASKQVVLWDGDPSKPPRPIYRSDADARRFAWTADGARLAAGLDNSKVVVLEAMSEKVLQTLERPGLNGGIRHLAWFADDRLAAVAANGAVSLWKCQSTPRTQVGQVGRVFRLAAVSRALSDEPRETAMSPAQPIEPLTPPQWEPLGDVVQLEVAVYAAATAPKGTAMALATSDGIVLWDADQPAAKAKLGSGPTYSVAWSGPLNTLIAAHEDRISLYDLASRELLCSQLIWWGQEKYVFLSPDGHARGCPGLGDDLVYVALTDEGRQITLRSAEFAERYGWKNDPQKVRLCLAEALNLPAERPSTQNNVPIPEPQQATPPPSRNRVGWQSQEANNPSQAGDPSQQPGDQADVFQGQSQMPPIQAAPQQQLPRRPRSSPSQQQQPADADDAFQVPSQMQTPQSIPQPQSQAAP